MPIYQVTTLDQSWLSASIARAGLIWPGEDKPGIPSPSAGVIWRSIEEDTLFEYRRLASRAGAIQARRSLARLHIPQIYLFICISPRRRPHTAKTTGSSAVYLAVPITFAYKGTHRALLTCLLRPDPRDQALTPTLPSRTHCGNHR